MEANCKCLILRSSTMYFIETSQKSPMIMIGRSVDDGLGADQTTPFLLNSEFRSRQASHYIYCARELGEITPIREGYDYIDWPSV